MRRISTTVFSKAVFVLLLSFFHAIAGTWWAMAHMNATSSRATATTTTWIGFLLALILLNLVHNRS